jgi:hypothetical protein
MLKKDFISPKERTNYDDKLEIIYLSLKKYLIMDVCFFFFSIISLIAFIVLYSLGEK